MSGADPLLFLLLCYFPSVHRLSLVAPLGAWMELTSRVWHPTKKEARFVEVKGPGDSLSETQKVWIDVLLSAGVPVEVCKVKAKIKGKADEEEDDNDEGEMKGGRGKKAAGVKRKSSGSEKSVSVQRTGKSQSLSRSQSRSQSQNGWKRVRNHDYGEDGEKDEVDEEDEEKGEFAYESGDEGKPEGKWEKR